MIDIFEAKLEEGSSLQGFARGVKDNQCIAQTVNKIVVFDVISDIETVTDIIKEHAKPLLEAMDILDKTLNYPTWKNVENSLKEIFDVIEPIKFFFKPFEPLASLMQKEIVLPWFKLPYSKSNLG